MADENDPTDEANDPGAEETGASTDFGGESESESAPDAGEGEGGDEEKSFRERVEEIRERRAEEREEGEEGDRERPDPEEMMGGGGGGNPFAQMMSGMMGGGGGPPGMGGGGGGPPGMGGGPGGRDPRGREEESGGNEELVREVRQLRDEVRDATRQLQRIAQALEDD